MAELTALLALILAIFAGAAAGLSYLAAASFAPPVPVCTAAGVFLILAAVSAVIIISALRGAGLFRSLIMRHLMPASLWLAARLGRDTDRVSRAFVDLNNRMVFAAFRKKPEKVLVLLPHCIQLDACAYKITHDIYKCVQCGRCVVKDFVELGLKYGFSVHVATGGTVARRLVQEERPDIVLAVACERDLTSGIRDSVPYPVIGITNERPNGPCINTTISLERLSIVLDKLTGTPSDKR